MVKRSNRKKDLGAPEWDLSDLYAGANDPKIDADLVKAAKEAEVFESRLKGQVKHLTEVALLAALIDYEVIWEKLYKVGDYPSLLVSSDTSNEAFKSLDKKIETKITEIRNHLLFFELELFGLSVCPLQKQLILYESFFHLFLLLLLYLKPKLKLLLCHH